MSTGKHFEQSSETKKAHPVRHAFASGISALCFLGILPLLAFCATWFIDSLPAPVVVLQSGMVYALLAAYPIFVFAVVARRKIVGVLSAFVVLCHVCFFAPIYALATPLPAEADGQPRIRLLSHNIRYDNPNPLQVIDEIERTNADIVFIGELTPGVYDDLREAGAFADYPYSALATRRGATGLGTFSKYPLRDAETVDTPSGYPQQRSVADVDGRDVVLWNIHTQSPVSGAVENWARDLELLDQRMEGETERVIMAGDFNATWGHKPFRSIVGDGVREAAIDRGRGYARSWPVDNKMNQRTKGWFLIDHVLTKNKIRPVSIHESEGNGSDHRAIITNLVLLP